MIRDHIDPFLGHLKIENVRSVDIGALLSHLSRVKNLSEQTCSHVYTLLHKAFDDAVHYFEFLEKNPVLRKVKPRVLTKEQDFLTPEESKRLLEVARNHYAGTAIWIGMYCGLRFGEIAALKIADIDFTKRQILVRAAYKQRLNCIEPYPKERRWKYVPMPEPLASYLQSKLQSRRSDDFVARGRYGRMLNIQVFGNVLRRLSKSAEVKEISSHKLRHSCSELWISQGASTEDIRRLFNHKDHSTTLRYIHRTDQRLSELAQSFTSDGIE